MVQVCCEQILVITEQCESNDCSTAGAGFHQGHVSCRATLWSLGTALKCQQGPLEIFTFWELLGGHSVEPTDGWVHHRTRISIPALQGILLCQRKALEWQRLTVRVQLYPRSLHLYRKDLLAYSDCLPMADRN